MTDREAFVCRRAALRLAWAAFGSLSAAEEALGAPAFHGPLPPEPRAFGTTDRLPKDDPRLPTAVTDVLVVGSGAAGAAAAVEARKAGAQVLVIEKMGSLGGNSVIAQGLMSVPGTPMQRAFGVEDSPEAFAADMLRVSYCGHPGHIALLAREALSTWKWTVEELGVRWTPDRVEQEIEQSRPRAVVIASGSGAGLMYPLLDRARALGAGFVLNEQVVRLLERPNDGRIFGVIVRNTRSGRLRRILARRGVVLAAGGFGADVAFRSFCNARLSERVGTTTQPGSTSEVLREAARVGARTIHLQYIFCIPDANPDEKGWGATWQFSRYAAGAQGLWVVRQTGERFTNEMGSTEERTNAVFDCLRAGRDMVAVADARAARHPRSTIFGRDDVENLVARGFVMKFPTLEALAHELGIPFKRLSEEVDQYNDALAKKAHYDRMGRAVNPVAEPMGEGPWYAAPLTAKVLLCGGGVAVDLRARVIAAEDDDPVPGLYAAGEITGGLHGIGYLGSCSLLDALVFGRIAGREAAAEHDGRIPDPGEVQTDSALRADLFDFL